MDASSAGPDFRDRLTTHVASPMRSSSRSTGNLSIESSDISSRSTEAYDMCERVDTLRAKPCGDIVQ